MKHKVTHVYARPSCMRPASWEIGRLFWSTGPEGSVAVLRGNTTGYLSEDDGQCAWAQLYKWVDDFCGIGGGGMTPDQADNWRYWCHSFKYMRGLAATDCAWGLHRDAIVALGRATDPKAFATDVVVPLRAQLVANVSAVVENLLQTVSNVGEIGTVAHMLSSDLPNTLWNRTVSPIVSETKMINDGCDIVTNNVRLRLCSTGDRAAAERDRRDGASPGSTA